MKQGIKEEMMRDISAEKKALLLTEALLFASASPVKEEQIRNLWEAQNLGFLGDNFSSLMEELAVSYQGRAIRLSFIAGGWQLRTREEFAPALKKIIERPRRLSRGCLESLAVIAYHQPCTRPEIEAIRGVSLGQNILDTLLEEGLIAPRGRKEVPGRPVLWGTTAFFLRSFGLERLSDLPKRGELVQEMEDEREEEIQEVLGPV